MGLCKCPKRRVTNQFCFEHRVNVCEHCMVTNHPKCVIQSYLHWLKDSDYSPACTLCSGALTDGDCVRLTCYHIFHWACVDAYARNLPATTAPAGYTCPVCGIAIFPQPNLVSPVADVLKEKLAGVNWARAGLGLPLLSDDREQKPTQERKVSVTEMSTSYQNHTVTALPSVATPRTSSNINLINSGGSSSSSSSIHSTVQKSGPPYSVVNVEPSMPFSNQASKKVFEAYDDPKDLSYDHDENKYQRKSAIEWFMRWWKLISRTPARRRGSSGSLYKRYVVVTVLLVLAFVGIIMLFSWLGRIATDGDPNFDVNRNNLVRVERRQE
ncbi:zinc finger protein-like 1 homolog [Neodiprion virginianus]|uniref:zinc finger protein-like 1 homolog n=1 Tax=Neodiprion virginianus TaxID=2961670 RepID=UPI001EE7688A|nr:zinc finger protein-like 1 homolog [Neodiprion virginianus]